MRMILITNWCFSFYWAVLALSHGCSSCSHCPARAGWGNRKGTREEPARTGWPQVSKGIFQSPGYQTEQEKQGKSTRTLRLLLGDWLGINQCSLYHCFCIFLIIITIIIIIIIIPSISVLLIWPYFYPWF